MTISDEFTLLKIVRDSLSAKNHDDVQLDSWDFDDCALIKIDETNSFAITSDFVRGTWFLPFQRGIMSYYDVWWYLIGANLSDLASIWATPLGLTTAIRYSDDIDDASFTEVFRGMNDICKKYNTSIIGWDSWSYASDVFCATAFWKVQTDKAMLRKNVQDGDVVCVTWDLWDAFAAMVYLKQNLSEKNILSKEEEERLFLAWKRLEPRVSEWMLLSEKCRRVAAEDISDWFKATALQMSAISWKIFRFYEKDIPISNEVKKIAEALDMDVLQLAFSASVDFELFITLSPEDYSTIKTEFDNRWFSFYKVWEVVTDGNNRIQRLSWEITDLPGTEWKQQSGDFIRDIIQKD